MQIIQNNPYRTVGLLVGATAAEQRRQLTRLQRFLEAEIEPEDDFSFPTLGHLHRTLDSVNEASSKLNLNSDKMNAALFWFYDGKTTLNTDEDAFNAIKEGDFDQVLSIWSKLTSSGEISQLNASAFSNLGTLYLSGILAGTNTNKVLLEQGISLKLKFLESDFITEFIALATEKPFKTTKNELQLLFLNQVQCEIEQSNSISINKFLEIVLRLDFSAKVDFLTEYVQKPIVQIEKLIIETRKSQESNPASAGDFGKKLFESTKNLISSIILILGKTDIRTVTISDKLANEILQCSITLFNHFHNSTTEIGEIALDLNKKANSIALGGIVKERINESTPVVEKYIKDRPLRERQSIVSDDLKYITGKLEMFQSLDDTINNSLNFAKSCKPYLDNIKLKLGQNDELYLTISTAVASNAQGMIVSTVNDAMEKRNNYVKYLNYKNNPLYGMSLPNYNKKSLFGGFNSLIENKVPYAPEYSLEALKKVISEAWKATVSLGYFDMSSKQLQNYNKNKSTLLELYKKLFDDILFIGNTPVKKWIFWVVGIGLFLLILATCE